MLLLLFSGGGAVAVVTPSAYRTYEVEAEGRVVYVSAENRAYEVSADG